MSAPFPHRYDVELSWGGREGALLAAGARPGIVGGAPPEFDGRENWWSPEHLLLSSLNLCLMTTFESLSRRAKMLVHGYRSRAEAVLDKTDEGLVFTAMRLHVEVDVDVADVERARQLVLSAKKHCIVGNALCTPVELDLTVSPAS